MRRFLASAWYPFLISLVLAGSAVAAFALLPTLESDISNSELLKVFEIAGWAIGPVIGLLSFLSMLILNGLRRLFRIRKVVLMHLVVVLLGLLPWLLWSSELLFLEPRFTPFARGAIDYVGRPMFVGSVIAFLLAIIFALPLLFSSKKRS